MELTAFGGEITAFCRQTCTKNGKLRTLSGRPLSIVPHEAKGQIVDFEHLCGQSLDEWTK